MVPLAEESATNQPHAAVIAVPLTMGKSAFVDEADYARVRQFKWSATWSGYTYYGVREKNGRRIYLHRFILEAVAGEKVDHRDRNGLNCTRLNLRRCTTGQNNCNRRARPTKSGFRGVDFRCGRWRAKIRVDRQLIHLGRYDSAEAAAQAYDRAARMHHGEFAFLNFPEVMS